MSSQPQRDPTTDPLLTPQNAALILIDYQAPQFNTVRSRDVGTILANVVALARTARLFGLPVVLSTVGVTSSVNPANRNRAIPLEFEQFRFAFANAVSEEEAHGLYETFAVPASGTPLFQAATANLNPWTEAKVDTKNPERGPLLIISGEQDNTVPWAIANATFERQQRNSGVTKIVEIPNRGHGLTVDSGWREVAGKALEFFQRFI